MNRSAVIPDPGGRNPLSRCTEADPKATASYLYHVTAVQGAEVEEAIGTSGFAPLLPRVPLWTNKKQEKNEEAG